MKILLMTFNSSYIHPNLALRWLYVARDPRHEVIIKEYTLKDKLERVIEEIESIKPDVIGMSVYIWNTDMTKELVRKLNKANQYRILIGGPEVSYEYQDWLNENIEGVIRGEGEVSFWKAVNQEKEVDGLVTKTYDADVKYARVDIEYLESLESPYFLSFDDEVRKNRYLYLETSRGCPYRCSYCLSSLDNKVRNFSLDYVYAQLAKLEAYPCKQVKFLDRTFNSHPKRALAIAVYINKLNVDFSFQFEVALEFFSEELLSFFENAKKDRFRFEVGVQTFNIDTLKAINRNQNEERLSKNIKRFASNDIVMHTDLIAGLPYEDYNSFKESFYKLFKLNSSEIQMGILKLLKGTKMKDEASLNEIIYSDIAPYEVMSTRWVCKEDMDKIKCVAKMIDKTYNNDRLKNTFNTLYAMGYDIFEIMAEAKANIDMLDKVQLFDYFNEVAKVLDKYQVEYGHEILLNDYYLLFNEKPKPLFKRPDEEVRKTLFSKLINKGYDEHELNQYSVLDYGYYDGKVYQLVIYSNKHKLERIELYDLDFNRIGD